MYVLVTFKAFGKCDASYCEPAGQRVLGAVLQRALGSGKVLASGSLADTVGGFFLIDVDSAEELVDSMGSDLLDNCQVEVNQIAFSGTVAKDLQHWCGGPRYNWVIGNDL